MNVINFIGLAAAVCTTISFLPQIVRIQRTKHAGDLSLPMYVIFSFGVFLWLCYGVLIRSLPVILANLTALLLCLYIVLMKIKYR